MIRQAMSVRGSAFIVLVVAVLLAISTCDCKRNCSHYDYYQEMERALVNDTENLFKLQQIFFPTFVDSDPQAMIVIKVCILTSDDYTSKDNSTAPTERCWIFDYSSTLLTGLITPAQLHAFESITAVLLINQAVHFHTHNSNLLNGKKMNLLIQKFPCNVSDQELYKSVATLTSWVRCSRCTSRYTSKGRL